MSIGTMVYVVAITTRRGQVLDIGPEIFTDEDKAWAAADAMTQARRLGTSHRSSSAKDYEVVPRRLIGVSS